MPKAILRPKRSDIYPIIRTVANPKLKRIRLLTDFIQAAFAWTNFNFFSSSPYLHISLFNKKRKKKKLSEIER